MNLDWSQVRSCVVLSMRHLGDAVILSGFVNALKQQNPKMIVDILGRPEHQEITQRFCSIGEYIGLNVPLYGHHRRSISSIRHAIQQITKIRSRKYDCCVNLMGDIRENFIGRMTRAKYVVAPAWPKEHPFSRHIRNSNLLPFATYEISISAKIPEFYNSMMYFTQQLGLPPLSWPPRVSQYEEKRTAPIIALHPGASHPSKQWSIEKWRSLIKELQQKGYRILLFGAPIDKDMLHREFHDEIRQYRLDCVTGGIGDFLGALISTKILVGLDSFSVHAAHALGVPAVVLHGPFKPEVMTPPNSIPLSCGHLCEYFPCYNGRSCKNTQNQYVCVRAIDVETVVNAIEEILKRQNCTKVRMENKIPQGSDMQAFNADGLDKYV